MLVLESFRSLDRGDEAFATEILQLFQKKRKNNTGGRNRSLPPGTVDALSIDSRDTDRSWWTQNASTWNAHIHHRQAEASRRSRWKVKKNRKRNRVSPERNSGQRAGQDAPSGLFPRKRNASGRSPSQDTWCGHPHPQQETREYPAEEWNPHTADMPCQ